MVNSTFIKTRHILFLGLISLCLVSFAFNKAERKQNAINFVGNTERDGSSFEKAIIITKKTETKGVKAEYTWLKKHYNGYSLKKQSLVYNNNMPYDKMDILTAGGENKTIYFDISNFFGNW